MSCVTDIHSLLSHTIILPSSTHTLVFHSTHSLLHYTSISLMALLSLSHLSYKILLFSSPTGPPSFSPCVQTTSTHSARPVNSLVIPVLLHTTSFLTLSKDVTPQILLRHLISITFNLFSVLLIPRFNKIEFLSVVVT